VVKKVIGKDSKEAYVFGAPKVRTDGEWDGGQVSPSLQVRSMGEGFFVENPCRHFMDLKVMKGFPVKVVA
jgi:hypothetical protein